MLGASLCQPPSFTTFLKATLLSILTFFLGLFVRSPAFHAPSITPYPLAPHLEGRVLDIGRDTSIDAAGKAMDLEMGFGVSYCRPATVQAAQNNLVSHGANKTSGAAASSTNVSSKPRPRARAHTVHHHPSAFNSSPMPKLEREITQSAPLSVATNFARVPGPPPKTAISRKIRDENKLPTPAQPSRKQPPRYLNLGVTSTAKPAKKQYPRHGKSLGSNIIIESMDRDTSSQLAPSAHAPLFPTPLKLEAGSIPGDSQDWAARIRSVLYKTREGDEDLAESVRNLFNRDSILALDQCEAVDIIEDRDSNLMLDDERDFGRHFRRVHSTFGFGSPSGQTSSSDESFDGPTTPSSPPPCSWSSGLPYLLERSTHLSLSPSLSADAFNDLLASVERKYPGRDWKDVVEFAADKGADGAKSCVGGQQRGSDV
ncbi:hypothetical protein DFH06DRAFT_1202782, partial [Mycena polygramma]